MEINEAQKELNKLMTDVSTLLLDYTKRTGLVISDIGFYPLLELGVKVPVQYQVTIKVQL